MIRANYSLDIMGREECSSIMPCKICRIFHDSMPIFPKEYECFKRNSVDI